MGMRAFLALVFTGLAVNAAAWCGLAWESHRDRAAISLLNVSYDPTRELWRDLNAAFADRWERDHGVRIAIRQSHGGSASQARAVMDGLPADVVTLALWSDTDAIRRSGLIEEDWTRRTAYGSLPYHSTIVFVVRKGERRIRDWPDLLRGDVQIVTPNPKTSGNGKLSFLAAWGSVRRRGGSDADAEQFVRKLFQRVPVLDTGARGSTTTFAQNGIGDVLLTWENEAHLVVRESRGMLEVVTPPSSIRAEPFVSVVDANVDQRGTRRVAEAYLQFLSSPEGASILERHFLRPGDGKTVTGETTGLPPIDLFSIEQVAGGWPEVQQRFFGDGGVFDRIMQFR